MKIAFKVILIISFICNLYGVEIDSLFLIKVKKLVEKEEEIASAYKKNILLKGLKASTINELKTNGYLPKGFDDKNPFGKAMTLRINSGILTDNTVLGRKDDSHQILSSMPSDIKINLNAYDYYYSNSNRKYTKAPMGSDNYVEIVLSPKEKFIYQNESQITINFASKNNKYYLDTNGVLHWYDNNGIYKFSYDKELILDENVNMLDSSGNKTAEFINLMANKNILYAGQTIIKKNVDVAEVYVNLGDAQGFKKVNSKSSRDVGKTVIQFSKLAGGMLINGDIYAWGNNGNRIVGINKDSYTTKNGQQGEMYPVMNTLIPLRAKIYDDDLTDGKDLTSFTTKGYFSSPLRPKFVDFYGSVLSSVCGITTKGALYCGGTTGLDRDYFGQLFTVLDTNRTGEMLYRSTFFDGKTNKALKLVQDTNLWLILSQSGDIYRWGYDGFGISGNRSMVYNDFNNPDLAVQKISSTDIGSSVKFTDITNLHSRREIAALSTTGDIYIWGAVSSDCGVYWQGGGLNACALTKISTKNSTLTENVTFQSIKSGLLAFLAKATNGKYYKIYQPTNNKIQVIDIMNIIKNYSEYKSPDDDTVLSIDFSSKLSGTALLTNQGIVWVNSKNELKGDYFTYQNKDDKLFKDAIKRIKWKKIQVLQDQNGMCGVDIYNQMYCWGVMSIYDSGGSLQWPMNHIRNTFMLPVFNTNLYDLSKDYLVAEGYGPYYLTNMTSGDWSTTTSTYGVSNPGAFFIKYPTYIGGFNYEFIFK